MFEFLIQTLQKMGDSFDEGKGNGIAKTELKFG